MHILGSSLGVQWLTLYAFNAVGMGLIPDWGTKIPHALWYGQNKHKNKHPPQKKTKQNQCCHYHLITLSYKYSYNHLKIIPL